MARVLLVSFAGYPYTPSSLLPDNGLAALAAALLDHGHAVRVLDFGTVKTLARLYPETIARRVRPLAERLFLEGRALSPLEKARFLWEARRLDAHQKREMERIAAEVASEAAAFGADLLGLKLWNGDGFTGAVAIARQARALLPGIRVIAGGPQVEYFREHILDYTDAFDILVCGDGELLLPELASALTSGREWRSLPGILWREGGRTRANPPAPGACLNDLPLPCYDPVVYPSLRDDHKIRIAVLDESRGCPNRCAFCIHPVKSGGTWRVKTAERVAREVRHVMDALGTRYLIYAGSNTSGETAVAIARQLIVEGLDVRYGCFGHVRGMSRADFDLLARSGCAAIFYGLESADPELLRRAFRKPLDVDAAARVICDTRAAGIRAIASIIYPAPFETPQSRQRTLDFLRRVRPDSVPVTAPGLIPGTPWEREAAAFGFEKIAREDFWAYSLTYKIKLLYPPRLWAPLPYRLNGKDSRMLFAETESFIADLERSGLLTNVPHEMALMAEALGEGHDLRSFRDRCRVLFLSGAAAEIARMVEYLNQSVRVDAKTAARGQGFAPAGAVAG